MSRKTWKAIFDMLACFQKLLRFFLPVISACSSCLIGATNTGLNASVKKNQERGEILAGYVYGKANIFAFLKRLPRVMCEDRDYSAFSSNKHHNGHQNDQCWNGRDAGELSMSLVVLGWLKLVVHGISSPWNTVDLSEQIYRFICDWELKTLLSWLTSLNPIFAWVVRFYRWSREKGPFRQIGFLGK